MADDADFDPSRVFLYTGKEEVPRNVVSAEVHPSVEEIPDGLFSCCDRLESVRLHIGLLWIGNHAFIWCSSLRRFLCPSTVTEIGAEAFQYCFNLVTIELPEGLETIEFQTFQDCTSLEGIRIPSTVACIGDGAFLGCTNLSSIELPDGVRTIGVGAFAGCSSLANFRVPSSVVEIGAEAFDGCIHLALVQLHEDLPTLGLFAFGRCPVSFRFARLTERMEVIGVDDPTRSMFENRLSEMTLAITEVDSDDEEDAEDFQEKCTRSLGRAHAHLTYLELKGAAPVLELALWKSKMEIEGEGDEGVQGEIIGDETRRQDPSNAERKRKRLKATKCADRDPRSFCADCRIRCGAGVVVPEVLKFFAYSTSWPHLDD